MRTFSTILGIDPGLHGGLLFLRTEPGKQDIILFKSKMPLRAKGREGKQEVDFSAIKDLLNKFYTDLVVLEKASPRPLEGSVSAFTSGNNWGAVRAICESMVGKDKMVLVSPRVWASQMHIDDIEQVPDPKERTLNAVRKLFPNENFLATVRSKVPHDGMVDACLIAKWGDLQGSLFLQKELEKDIKVSVKKKKKKGKKNVTTKKQVRIQQ